MSALATLDAKILQGSLTLLAAILASGTALLVAFVAYPRQKGIDRQLELQRERRELYREFAAAYENYTSEEPQTLVEWSEARARFESVIGQVVVSAPDDVADAVIQLKFADDQLRKEDEAEGAYLLSGAMHEQYRACLWTMRKDSFSGTQLNSALFSEDAKRRLPTRTRNP